MIYTITSEQIANLNRTLKAIYFQLEQLSEQYTCLLEAEQTQRFLKQDYQKQAQVYLDTLICCLHYIENKSSNSVKEINRKLLN